MEVWVLNRVGPNPATSDGVAGASSDASDEQSSKRIVGYYPSWAGDYTPRDVPYEKLTHLDFAFLEPNSDGEVELPGADGASPGLLEQFREETDEHEETSFMFSISAGWYSGTFSDAALTAERRQRFARTAVEFVQTYDFDGIDVDWEHPDGTIREDDPHHLTLLLAEIRRQLDELGEATKRDDDDERDGRQYELSMTVAPEPSIADPLEVAKLGDYVDFINVMNYDVHHEGTDYTTHNAPLYPAPDDPNGDRLVSAHDSMQYWAEQPIAREKLTFGVPFYGWSFEAVPSENDGLFQPFGESDSETYWNVRENVEPKSHYEYHWHAKAEVPWLYSPEDRVLVSYDDERSIANKTEYVVDNDFGGVMCWELSQDPSNTLIETIHGVLAGSEDD